jgi:hypothetical protein
MAMHLGEGQWYISKKVLEDGRCVYLFPTIFNLRIGVSKDTEDKGFTEFYCFHDNEAAFEAMDSWNGTGDPEGWVRHVPSHRRRPHGDPSKEYVAA